MTSTIRFCPGNVNGSATELKPTKRPHVQRGHSDYRQRETKPYRDHRNVLIRLNGRILDIREFTLLLSSLSYTYSWRPTIEYS